jgi:hypothetical protein
MLQVHGMERGSRPVQDQGENLAGRKNVASAEPTALHCSEFCIIITG